MTEEIAAIYSKLGSIRKPLVSLIVVNWNYARFVRDTIKSIAEQSYRRFECLVIDNGSDDDSATAIGAQIEGDARFRLERLSNNIGHLGAGLWSLDKVKGDFIVFVDADDLLFSNYLTSHLQVHLAARYSTAFTSSNIVEMNSAGSIIGGGCRPLSRACFHRPEGMRSWSDTAQMSIISEQRHQALANATRYVPPDVKGWVWGPGTSNMYRRQLLLAFTPTLRDPLRFGGIDCFFNPILHSITGTTLIDVPLSAYRIHGANDYTRLPSMSGIHSGTKEAEIRNSGIIRLAAATVIETADAFTQMVGSKRFWQALDVIAHLHGNWPNMYSHFDIRRVIVDNFQRLKRLFGDGELQRELRARMQLVDYSRCIKEAHGDRFKVATQCRILGLQVKHIIEQYWCGVIT